MLIVSMKPILLSVVMLSCILLNVKASQRELQNLFTSNAGQVRVKQRTYFPLLFAGDSRREVAKLGEKHTKLGEEEL
jgi:hypothetical protein